MIILVRMITELGGCSLAQRYPCLSRQRLTYHIIFLNRRICRGIKREDTPTSSAAAPPFPLVSSACSSVVAITHDAQADPVVMLKHPGCDTNSGVLVM